MDIGRHIQVSQLEILSVSIPELRADSFFLCHNVQVVLYFHLRGVLWLWHESGVISRL